MVVLAEKRGLLLLAGGKHAENQRAARARRRQAKIDALIRKATTPRDAA